MNNCYIVEIQQYNIVMDLAPELPQQFMKKNSGLVIGA